MNAPQVLSHWPCGERASGLAKAGAGMASSWAPELAHITLHGDDGPSFLGEGEGHCHFLGTSCGAWCLHMSSFSFLMAQL